MAYSKGAAPNADQDDQGRLGISDVNALAEWQMRSHYHERESIQVVPGQARGGSFKFETIIAYRAEQRLCLYVTGKPPVHRSNKLLTCQSGAKSFELIFSHFI